MNRLLKDSLCTQDWGEIVRMESRRVNSNTSRNLVEVEAELRLLSVELSMSVDILGKIRDSVHVLQQSLEGI